jgi:hypothetical protein
MQAETCTKAGFNRLSTSFFEFSDEFAFSNERLLACQCCRVANHFSESGLTFKENGQRSKLRTSLAMFKNPEGSGQ